jgi:prevent-host-death family protein
MKRTAAVAELKAQLSRFLRRVKAGEEILVVERGVPIARLTPVTGAPGADAQLRELEERGLARVGSGRLSARFWRLARRRDPEGLVRKAAAEDRERGW